MAGHRVVFVKAHFKAVGKYVNIKVPTGETRKGRLGLDRKIHSTHKESRETGTSITEIDGERLAADIQSALTSLAADSFRVIAAIPITSGRYDCKHSAASGPDTSGGWGYGYGYSVTEGVTLIATAHESSVGEVDATFSY